MSTREGKSPRRFLPSRAMGRSFWIRLIAVGIFDALVVAAIPLLATNESWVLLAMFVLAGAMVNWAYLSPRAQASKWLTPGLVFMAFFVVYPVAYTFYVSITNWSTGFSLTKDIAIERLEERKIDTDEATQIFDLSIYRDGDGTIAFLLTADDTAPVFATARPRGATSDPSTVVDLSGIDVDPAAPPDVIGAFEHLTGLQLTGIANQLEGLVADVPGGGVAQVETFTRASVVTTGQRFFYDPSSDTLFDAQEDRTCRLGQGTFLCDGVAEADVSRVAIQQTDTTIRCDGGTCNSVPLNTIDQTFSGWRTVIGFDNYADIFTNARIRRPFLSVFAWNMVFALGSVFLTFTLGLILANALIDERLKGRAIYRSIFILPYAVPAFLSTLIWRGLLNDRFGQVNGFLGSFGIDGISWLSDPFWARVSVLLVNLWLGFPYMFLITSGALTSIPEELKEAARVDGAGPWKVFRMITLPLLLVSTAPLLIGSFAFNFNNLVLILLLTGGGPPLTGFDVPVGSTDILISFTFNLATGSGRGNQFALASAIVIVIFLIVALLSAISFRYTKRLEEVYAN